jgi:hypothetical protein
MTNIKCFSLIVALKRKKKNSKILKRAKYKLASDYNLHPTTFCKLLQQCISEGWIEEIGEYYHIKKFSFIVKDFCEKSDLRFHFHEILGPDSKKRHQNFDQKQIVEEILSKLLLDNVMAPQEYIISLKKGLSSKNSSRTVKRSMMKLKKLGFYSCADDVEKEIQESVVTSDRHTARKLKITRYRARKVLNAGIDITREIKSDWRPLRNALVDYDAARREFPRATVLILPHYGQIKICHGSVLTRVNKKYGIT